MKHVLRLVLALTVCADAARADVISLYADVESNDCTLNVLVSPPGINTLYVVHWLNGGAIGAEFTIDDNSGLVPVSQTTPYLWIGSWYTGISIVYGGCVAGDHVIGTLNYLWLETPTTCENSLLVVAYPNEQTVIVYDCSQPYIRETAYSRYTSVGPDADSCDVFGGCCQCVIPTSETTWGAVKALYR